MRTLIPALAAIALFGSPALALGQEEEASAPQSLEERLEKARKDYFAMKSDRDRSPDLWYGTPGVRPGGDLIGPISDLLRRPSGLLDFRPRKVEPWLPDRETAEFLRERR